jgi:hypothetical protein
LAANVLPIIEEFLRAAVPQQRKNALIALTVIGDAASVRILAQAALGDEDAGVRAHALDEIASLGEEKVAAVGVFEKELHSGDRAKQVRAYAVLGRLQSVGAYEADVDLTFRSKLLLAASLYKHLYVVKNWDFRLRSWRAALLGSLAGSLILIPTTGWVYLLHKQTDSLYQGQPMSSTRIIYYVIGALLIVGAGAVASMIASQRATPINLHISFYAAVAVEMLTAIFLGFIGTLGYYAVLSALVDLRIEKSVWTLGFMLLAGLLAAVVRAASAQAFGLYTNLKMNWMAEVLAGTVVGFVLVTSVVLISLSSGAMTGDEARFISMGSVPFAMGYASAFASIDIASPPARSPQGRSAFLLQILFPPAVLALGLAIGFVLLLVTS